MKLDSIIDTIKSIETRDSAREYQDSILSALKMKGFECSREFKVESRGTPDGYRGFVDIVVEADGERCGIEIDRKSPRKKSIHKLLNGPFDERIIVLREGERYGVYSF